MAYLLRASVTDRREQGFVDKKIGAERQAVYVLLVLTSIGLARGTYAEKRVTRRTTGETRKALSRPVAR